MSDEQNPENQEQAAENAEDAPSTEDTRSAKSTESTESTEDIEGAKSMEHMEGAKSMEHMEGAESAAKGAAGAKHEAPAGRVGSEVNMDTLLKVPVSLSIEVGRARMPLSQVLDTREGTVIELERLLDEPLDILVNGALIAHGVVVMANDRFGIQITDIVSPQERVRHV